MINQAAGRLSPNTLFSFLPPNLFVGLSADVLSVVVSNEIDSLSHCLSLFQSFSSFIWRVAFNIAWLKLSSHLLRVLPQGILHFTHLIVIFRLRTKREIKGLNLKQLSQIQPPSMFDRLNLFHLVTPDRPACNPFGHSAALVHRNKHQATTTT